MNHAQRRELHDPALVRSVYERDAGRCRYCRTGPLELRLARSLDASKVLAYDYADPDLPAGPDGENVVTCCGACNAAKGIRTPGESGMPLLPVPTIAQRVAWGSPVYGATPRGFLADELGAAALPVPSSLMEEADALPDVALDYSGDKVTLTIRFADGELYDSVHAAWPTDVAPTDDTLLSFMATLGQRERALGSLARLLQVTTPRPARPETADTPTGGIVGADRLAQVGEYAPQGTAAPENAPSSGPTA